MATSGEREYDVITAMGTEGRAFCVLQGWGRKYMYNEFAKGYNLKRVSTVTVTQCTFKYCKLKGDVVHGDTN